MTDLYTAHLQTARLSDTAQALSRGEYLDKDRSIIAQSAGKDAAEIAKALIYAGELGADQAFEMYDDLKTRIFNSTLALAGAESVVEEFEGDEDERPARRSSGTARRGSGEVGNRRPSGGGSNDPGTLEIRAGKHAGKTIAQVANEDPQYLEWAVDNLKNDFLRGKIEEYLLTA